MTRTILLLLLLAACLSGCGAHAEPAKQEVTKKPKKEKKAPIEIPVIEVQSDTFASPEAALAALRANHEAPEGQERKDQEVRVHKWLVMQGDTAVPAVAALATNKEESPQMRNAACRILGQLGPQAIDPLVDVAENGEPTQLRRKAIESLGMVKPEQKTVDALTRLLDDSDSLVQWEAIRVLTKIGPQAKAALPQLHHLRSEHPEEQVRVSAGEALKKIDPRATFND